MQLSKAGDCNRKNQWCLETNRLSCFKTITKLLPRYINKTIIMKKILYFIALSLLLCGSCKVNKNITKQHDLIPDTVIVLDENGDTIDIGISYDKPTF